MGMTNRRAVEGFVAQGEDEKVAYRIDVTNWGNNPSSPSVKIYDEDRESADVSATCLSGSPGVSGNVITTPLIQNLTRNHDYRVEVQFAIGGNTLECFFEVRGER